MAGRRTSLYVPIDLTDAADAAKKAGRSLTDILRAGFAAEGFTEPAVTRADLDAAVATLLAAIKAKPGSGGKPAAECKHPGVGYKQRCPACEQYNMNRPAR